jgi:allophanate hydrolase
VDFALGTDTAGSGRVPAGLNNIVGLKPSKGLMSAHGVVPAAQSVDCVSILTREVGLAVDVLKAAMGEDALDPFSRSLSLSEEPWTALVCPMCWNFSGMFKRRLPLSKRWSA